MRVRAAVFSLLLAARATRLASAPLDIHLQPVPATLTPVMTTAVACKPARGAGQALALFQQARFALLANTVAPDVTPARMSVARYHQKGTDDHDMLQTLAVVNGMSNRAFAATLSPAEMVAQGFLSGAPGGGRIFHGLDPELLLSDEFEATHCFDVTSGSGSHRGQVGSVFTPAADRTRLVDVSGTIWLDQSPLALRALEFRYENVGSAASKAGAGGTFTFRTARNGVVLIDDCQLRILAGAMTSLLVPQMADILRDALGSNLTNDVLDAEPDPVAAPAAIAARNVPMIQVEGGSILTAVWADGSEVRRPLDVVQGTVREHGTGRPLAGIVIRLANTPYHTITAEDGSFRMTDVYPGRYPLTVVDSAWAPFRLGRPVAVAVEARDDRPAAARIEMEERAVAIQRLCDLTGSSTGPAMLVGRVLDARGQLTTAQVWAAADDRGHVGERIKASVSSGQFWMCGFFPGKVTFTATDDAHHKATSTVTLSRDDITRLTLVLGQPPR
jgi:hypothetical protein